MEEALRLDAGPAALHRLPESVAHAAEALWMQALDEGRRRAAQENSATTRAVASDKQTLEVRSHILSLRENELESKLRDREQRQTILEAQVQDLTTLLRKEQATQEAQARRIAALEGELLARHQPTAKVRRPNPKRTRAIPSERRRIKSAAKSPPRAKKRTKPTKHTNVTRRRR